MDRIFPTNYTRLTTITGNEKVFVARGSDGKPFYVLASDLMISETPESIKNKLGITVLSGINTGDQDLSGKVDKVTGKSLVDDVEIIRLASVTNQDISGKVDKDGTKVLSDVNFSSAKDAKLSNIAANATANDTDANLKNRANHTGNQAATTITEDSTHRFSTDSEKATWNAKEPALPTGGTTAKYLRGDKTWQDMPTGGGGGPASTDSLSEGTTNLYFTVVRVLASVLSGYTAGTTYTALGASDTILQAFQKIQGMFAVIKNKLDGIADNATANSSDIVLKDRANHTGSQAQSTITNLTSDLAGKAPLASPAFTGTITGITAAMVGLGSVNNTADTAKPVSTAQQAALALKANIAVTVGSSAALAFVSDNIQGSVGTPLTGNITASTTGAVVGVVVHIVHNAGTAPTFDSKFKKLSGSGSYITGAINHIYCEYMSATEILYTIQQRT